MYIETSSNNSGSKNVSISFEKADIIQISKFTPHYNRFSAGNNKSVGRLRIHLLLPGGQWHLKYII